MKTVKINLKINGILYEGEAYYDEEKREIDLSKSLEKPLGKNWGTPVKFHGIKVATADELFDYEVMRQVCPDSYEKCEETGYYFPEEEIEICHDTGKKTCHKLLVRSETMLDYLSIENAVAIKYRYSDGEIYGDYVTEEWTKSACYCKHCKSYLRNSEDYVGNDTCKWCAEE